VQREVEAWGIPTVSLSNNRAHSTLVKPPRWVYVHFPRGSMFGEPGNADKQRKVLKDTLEAAYAIAEPGGNVELPYRWEAAPVMYQGRAITEGS
jgi:hypothetical protein